MTRVVDRLCRQGLVERVRTEADGRGRYAVLTAGGLRRLQEPWPTHLASRGTSWITSLARTWRRSPKLRQRSLTSILFRHFGDVEMPLRKLPDGDASLAGRW
jgi:DNA-binding MarR family transcriptional regulator